MRIAAAMHAFGASFTPRAGGRDIDLLPVAPIPRRSPKEAPMNAKSLPALFLAAMLGVAASGTAAAQSNGVLMRSDGIYLRCDQCGTVQRVEQNVTQGGGHGTAGTIIGAIAGGVLGNQVGKGKGRKLATVGGAVGGGFAGHAIGNNAGSSTSWTVRIKMGNGSYQNIQVKDASGIRQGDLVQVDGNGNITRIQ
jgi:outer membrane lipoprotein SlyB